MSLPVKSKSPINLLLSPILLSLILLSPILLSLIQLSSIQLSSILLSPILLSQTVANRNDGVLTKGFLFYIDLAATWNQQ